MSTSSPLPMNKTFRIAIISLFSAILVVLQIALAPIPNVETVTILFLIYGLVLPLSDNLLIVFVFSTLQALVWGFGEWTIGYYWIWGLWTILIAVLKPYFKDNLFSWAATTCVFGLSFGALFAINYGIFYGINFTFAYWIRGIGFHIVHGISNYLITLILFNPLLKTFKKLGGNT